MESQTFVYTSFFEQLYVGRVHFVLGIVKVFRLDILMI